MSARRLKWGIGALTALLGGCSGGERMQPEESIGTATSMVQWNYGSHYWVAGAGVWNTSVSPAIGISYVPVTGVPGFTAPCGVTFISRHFAITAAHCVDKDHLVADNNNTADPGDSTFRVSQFDTSALSDWNAFQAQAIVTGTGPFYNTARPMGCSSGFCISASYTKCRVRARCSSTFGKENCPAAVAGMNNQRGADIALIHCADRQSTRPFVTVDRVADSVGPNVQVWWYHEVKYLATDSNGVDPNAQPLDNWEHYGHYDGTDIGVNGKKTNYHYTTTAQTFMLTSKQWPSGAQYYTTATDANTAGLMWSDAYACHGTSGSGVFINGTSLFLGPVVGAGTGFTIPGQTGNQRLCMDVNVIAPGMKLSSFIAASVTRQLEAMALSDR